MDAKKVVKFFNMLRRIYHRIFNRNRVVYWKGMNEKNIIFWMYNKEQKRAIFYKGLGKGYILILGDEKDTIRS